MLFLCVLLASGSGLAQTSTDPLFVDKLREQSPRSFTLTNARIWLAPGKVLERGTIVIERGLIVDVGAGVKAPAGSSVVDLGGKTVYPAFLDLVSAYGVDPAGACESAAPPAPVGGPPQRGPMPMGQSAAQTPSARAPRHWNNLICAERDLGGKVALDEERSKLLRQLGFASVLSAPASGILRGQSALLSLKPKADAHAAVLAVRLAQHAGLEQAFGFGGVYPGSTMGAYALVRQAFGDARWQIEAEPLAAREGSERAETNITLEALRPVLSGAQPLFWHTRDELDYARAGRVAKDFNLKLVIGGNGAEYRRLKELSALNSDLILPLNFPATPDVGDPETALERSLAELEHWRYAAFNPRLVRAQGIRFALSASGLEKPEEQFLPNLRKAIAYGLPADAAIESLTAIPARMIGQADRLGSIARGRLANLLIADATWPAQADAQLYQVWVEGVREELKPLQALDLRGTWKVQGLSDGNASWVIDGAPELKVSVGKTSFKATRAERAVNFRVPGKLLGQASETVVVTADLSGDTLRGRYLNLQGVAQPFMATRTAAAKPDSKPATPISVPELPSTWRYPAGEYGLAAIPEQPKSVLFKQATVWMTGAPEPLPNTDVLVEQGVIKAVGPDLKGSANTLVIDAQGKHLTPGLVDAHSHIAISGNVNEPSHTVTSEVRIADVVDPTDIDIYRQLAGGLTTAHLMHGSANTIGGQSQVIRLRWGQDAAGLIFKEAAPTIKFALGENPKQANWGDMFRTRYPQTRMGVEQLLVDSFTAAQAYAQERAAAAKAKRPFRTDLRLEALDEVLRGVRMIHVHSYRQDEILMFARLSQRFGFKVAAFQHVLEGYKVAPELNEIGAGASSFADWWAFKMEVMDAIPYNNALLTRAGVVTSSNSDSNDLARRMNTEAAKAVRFGDLTPTEALALVTINPAKQLRIEQKVGSIEVGKDADLVLWNRQPLSSMARAEQTWIEGRKYFDLVSDEAEQKRVQSAREALVQLALKEGDSAKPAGPPGRPAARFALDLTRGYPAFLTARRGLYHNGEPVHLCQGEF